jgi:hypothetical protein
MTSTAEQAKAKRKYKLTWGEVTEKNIGQLRLMDTINFPVTYYDPFYRNIITNVQHSNEDWTKLGMTPMLLWIP